MRWYWKRSFSMRSIAFSHALPWSKKSIAWKYRRSCTTKKRRERHRSVARAFKHRFLNELYLALPRDFTVLVRSHRRHSILGPVVQVGMQQERKTSLNMMTVALVLFAEVYG